MNFGASKHLYSRFLFSKSMDPYEIIDDIVNNTNYALANIVQQDIKRSKHGKTVETLEEKFSRSIDEIKEIVSDELNEMVNYVASQAPKPNEANYEIKKQYFDRVMFYAIKSLENIQQSFETAMGVLINTFYNLAIRLSDTAQRMSRAIKNLIRQLIDKLRR